MMKVSFTSSLSISNRREKGICVKEKHGVGFE